MTTLLNIRASGSPGSTTITDYSSSGWTVSAEGTTAVSDDYGRCGPVSIKIPYGENRLALRGQSLVPIEFPNGQDFCFEIWAYFTGWTNGTDRDARLIANTNTGGYGWGCRWSTNLFPASHSQGCVKSGVSWFYEEPDYRWVPINDSWRHLVFQVRTNPSDGNQYIEIFDNGMCTGEIAWGTNNWDMTGTDLVIMSGIRGIVYVDKVRIDDEARFALSENRLDEGVQYFTPPGCTSAVCSLNAVIVKQTTNHLIDMAPLVKGHPLYYMNKDPEDVAPMARYITTYQDLDSVHWKHIKSVDLIGDYGLNDITLYWDKTSTYGAWSSLGTQYYGVLAVDQAIRWYNLGHARRTAFAVDWVGPSNIAHQAIEVKYNIKSQ